MTYDIGSKESDNGVLGDEFGKFNVIIIVVLLLVLFLVFLVVRVLLKLGILDRDDSSLVTDNLRSVLDANEKKLRKCQSR